MSRQTTGAPGYITYREAAIMFSLMGNEDAAQAIKATANYFLYGKETELTGAAAEVFKIMKADIDKNNIKYAAVKERNRENGKKGGGPRKE